MSGKVTASNTPWMKTALRQYEVNHPDDLARIEAALPDGVQVAIFCIASPRPLGVYINGLGEPIRIEPAYHTVGGAFEAALRLVEARVAA